MIASWFAFLRIEADLAMTFIDCAKLSTTPQGRTRSLGNAFNALAEIHRGLMNPASRGLSQDEVAFLADRHTQIEAALAELDEGISN